MDSATDLDRKGHNFIFASVPHYGTSLCRYYFCKLEYERYRPTDNVIGETIAANLEVEIPFSAALCFLRPIIMWQMFWFKYSLRKEEQVFEYAFSIGSRG